MDDLFIFTRELLFDPSEDQTFIPSSNNYNNNKNNTKIENASWYEETTAHYSCVRLK